MQIDSSGVEESTTGEKNLTPFSIPVVWTWKESQYKVSTHPQSSIWGNREGCWIKYNYDCNAELERAYRNYASGLLDHRQCELPTYSVDFLTMTQTNRNTDYKRQVERHVAFGPLIELHYNGNQYKVDEAYQCCDSLNQIMSRIENEVRESVERDIHFGIHHQNSSLVVPREYFRQKQVDCFVEVIRNCRTVFKQCCQRAGVSSESQASDLVLRPDSRCAAECCLGEDAREMCLHFIVLVKERLERCGITDERVTVATDELLMFLDRMKSANSKRLFTIGVTRGDPSRPLRSRGWNQGHVIDELNAKTEELIELTSHDASSFRPETKTFLRTLHKYLECREKMDARYLEVDEFQLIARRILSTDSGGILLLLDDYDGDSLHAKAEYQQQSISGNPVTTMDELYEAASVTQPYYRDLIGDLMQKLGERMGSLAQNTDKPIVTFGDLKDRRRAHEKAQDDYTNFVPGPGFCWLYDIVRGSIEFHSAAEVLAFVDLIQEDESIHIVKAKNRFREPSLTGYRDLNIQFQITVNGSFKHICEIQIHHHAIRILDKELNTHQYYEYFRSYFAGATRSLKDRLEDLQLIAGNGKVDESFLHFLLPTCVEEERLERLGYLFEVQLSEYHWAMRAYTSLLDLRIRKFGLHHPATAKTYCSIGNVKNSQAKIEDASLFYKASLRSDRSTPMVLASTYRGMAKVMALQKNTGDAMALFQTVVETGEKFSLPFVVDSYIDMANLLRDGGDLTRSMELYERALDISKQKYGEENQHVAIILQNMARILRRDGRMDDATKLYQKSLEFTKRTLGEDHLSTAEIYQSLGLITQQQGCIEAAFEMYGKALKMYQKRFGEFHSQVADSYDMLASVRWQENLYVEAMALHDNARRIREILNARGNPRQDYLTSSSDSEYSIFDEHLVGEDHPYFVFGLRCRSHNLLHSDNPERALEPYRLVIDILQRNFGNQHSEIANAYQEMATLLRRLGRLDEAMETYETFRSIMSQDKYKTLGPEFKFEWAVAYEEMARLLQERSRDSEALEVMLEALVMRKEMAMKSSFHTLKTLSTIESFSKLAERILENHEDELIRSEVTNARRSVLADGLEIYHEMLNRTGSSLFDLLTHISESIDCVLHEQEWRELRHLVAERDLEALGATLPKMIQSLRSSHPQ